eukprot:195260_1
MFFVKKVWKFGRRVLHLLLVLVAGLVIAGTIYFFLTVRSPYKLKEHGQRGTLAWRMFYERDGKIISPWHDIDLYYSKKDLMFNMVTEIPRGKRAKNEMDTHQKHNPLKQDTTNGELRFFKYGDFPFNYGYLPQTWESPYEKHPATGVPGDKDPIDVVETSDSRIPVGSVVCVKVLGVFGMIDGGETDWKLIAVACDDPLAKRIDDIPDLKRELPKMIPKIHRWYLSYKTYSGGAQTKFSNDDKPYSKAFALKVIRETNHSWQLLVDGKVHSEGIYATKSK